MAERRAAARTVPQRLRRTSVASAADSSSIVPRRSGLQCSRTEIGRKPLSWFLVFSNSIWVASRAQRIRRRATSMFAPSDGPPKPRLREHPNVGSDCSLEDDTGPVEAQRPLFRYRTCQTVRSGSLADIRERIRDVRFTPRSRHAHRQHQCLLSAISGHQPSPVQRGRSLDQTGPAWWAL
jgi:hypothetical protein